MINKEKGFDYLIIAIGLYAIYLFVKIWYRLEKHEWELENLQTLFIEEKEEKKL